MQIKLLYRILLTNIGCLFHQIKTLKIDSAIACKGFAIGHKEVNTLRTDFTVGNKLSRDENGLHIEPGYYTLGPVTNSTNSKYDIVSGVKQLKGIEEDILKYFSRA